MTHRGFHGTPTNMRRVSGFHCRSAVVRLHDRVVSMLLDLISRSIIRQVQLSQEHAISVPHFGMDTKRDAITDGLTKACRFSSVVFATLALDRCLPVSTDCKPRQAPRAVSDQPRCQQLFHIHVHTCLLLFQLYSTGESLSKSRPRRGLRCPSLPGT